MRIRDLVGLIVLLCPAAFAQDYSGSWCGTTSQGKAIYFRVVNNQVTWARLAYATNGTGSGCPVGSSKPLSPPVSISGAKATFGETSAPIGAVPVLWSVNATFNSSSDASGTFSVAVQAGPFVTCGGVNPGASGTWTATRSAPLAISPSTQSFGSGGGSGRISVAAASPCGWDASEFVSWITVQGSSGAGDGAVRFQVASNATGASRSTDVNVNELGATVTQGTTPEVRQLTVVGSTAGNFGSFFKTAVQIYNRTNGVMNGRFVFHVQGQSGSDSDPSLTYSLATNQTLYYSDLLPAMNQGGLGSIDVVSTAGGFPVTVARIFNDAGAAGTTGMTEDLIGGQDPLTQGSDGVLIAPPDAAAARFNIGVRALGSGATIRAGTALNTYAANEFRQVSATDFAGPLSPATTRLRCTSTRAARSCTARPPTTKPRTLRSSLRGAFPRLRPRGRHGTLRWSARRREASGRSSRPRCRFTTRPAPRSPGGLSFIPRASAEARPTRR